MKIRFAFFWIIFVALPASSFTQPWQESLRLWAQQNPIEKLYLHIDRDSYYAGETIWAKGYFMSGFLPSTSSSVLYVELLNDRSELLVRNVFPVYGGTAAAQLVLPDSLSTHLYQLRAYSPLMLNQPPFTFTRFIQVHGKENKRISKSASRPNNKLQFFPEGGNFITGLSNTVAFKATQEGGLPLAVEGEIRNGKHEFICRFKSVHDGMGTFSITPVEGETYYAITNRSTQKYALPQPASAGLVFNLTDVPGGKRFKIRQGGEHALFKPAYMVGQVHNTIIFKQPLQGDKKELTGFVKTADLYSGILQLTLFNKDDMPLAERITFVDNGEYVLPAALKVEKLDTGKRQQNHFTLQVPDSVIGSFSVSVTDADYESTATRQTNIYTQFLLIADLRGYIHNPAYYFNQPGDAARQALDLVMMTNGWTRFKWSDAIKDQLPRPLYQDPGYIQVSGKVNKAGTKKPLAQKDVLLYMAAADSTGKAKGTSLLMQTDAEGRFQADSLLFYGKRKLLFSEVRGKKNEFIKILLDADSLTRSYAIAPHEMPFVQQKNTGAPPKMDTAYQQYLNGKGITLANVTVRSLEKSPLDQLDAEYASGYFSSATHSTRLDLRNESFAGDIFLYLKERIPGLKVYGEIGDYVLSYRDFFNFGEAPPPNVPRSSTGNVTLFLNEMPAHYSTLESIPLNDIALVKLFPTSTAVPGGGAALVVYTKKGKDSFPSAAAATDILTYQGYTIVKEFYHPDYREPAVNNQADRRITLTWKPDIIVNGSTRTIPVRFYNNDETRRFKMVVEGITSDGRMLLFEKIIEPGK